MRRHSVSPSSITLAAVCVLVLAIRAFGLEPEDAACRRALGRGVRGLQKALLSEEVRCLDRTMNGQLAGVDCTDPADPAFPGAKSLLSKRLTLEKLAQGGCIRADSPQHNGYLVCPSPCGSTVITDYASVAECLECTTAHRASVAVDDVYGNIAGATAPDQIRCQATIGKALARYADARMKTQQRCQSSEDRTATGINCQTDDGAGALAKAVLQLRAALVACDSPILRTLDSCGSDLSAEQSCLEAEGNMLTNDLFKDVYDPDGFRGVFVSTNRGVPSGAGTIDNPLDSINNGIAVAAAAGRTNVFVDGGNYIESLDLPSNLNVIGGFNSDFGWIRDGSETAIVGGTTAVLANGRSNITLDGLTIIAGGNRYPGGSSYGVRLIVSTNVVIHRSSIFAGDGGPGAAGAAGRKGLEGAPGSAGQNGCQDSSVFCSQCAQPIEGRGGGGPSCYGSRAGTGGSGGRPGKEVAGGSYGHAGLSGTPGSSIPGSAGLPGAPGGNFGAGGNGGTGGRGVDGTNGAGGGDFGGGGAVYLPANGAAGTVGGGGAGGGGGGGGGGGDSQCDSYGGAGGGGGGGGCGGEGGGGGTGAGGSFGIWVNGGTVTVADSEIMPGRGGLGGTSGAGGDGGAPGSQGIGGAGEDDSGIGGRGGKGGEGGVGGRGGGGGGGPAIGIHCTDPGTVAATSNTFTPGTNGLGGASPGGNPGSPGRVRDMNGC